MLIRASVCTNVLYPVRDLTEGAEVVIAPPAIYLISLKELLRGDFKVAAQNCYVKTSGAYTGEIRYVYTLLSCLCPANTDASPAQLADAGIPYVVLGEPSVSTRQRARAYIHMRRRPLGASHALPRDVEARRRQDSVCD